MIRPRFLLVALAAATLAACGSDREAIGSSQRDEPANASEQDSAAADDAESKENSGDPGEAKELTARTGMTSGVDSIDELYTTVGALVTNPNKDLAAYDVTAVFNLVDESGETVETDSTEIPYIPAGATVPVSPTGLGYDLTTAPSEVTVDLVGDFAEDTGWDGVGLMMGEGIDLQVGQAALTTDEYGMSLGFTVTNPSDTVAEWADWSCVFQQGDQIVGGDSSGISDPIVPGGTVRVDSPLLMEKLTADTITCRAYA